MIRLVLGGARSGKSRYAEGLGAAYGERIYIATSEVIDAEMRVRIAAHRDQRGPGWTTIEAPFELTAALGGAAAAPGRFVLVDCITLWINNLIYSGRNVEEAVAELCAALSGIKADVVMVSNEVGLGIVPDNALARAFRDLAGRANQTIAAAADEVVFIAAGLPLKLK